MHRRQVPKADLYQTNSSEPNQENKAKASGIAPKVKMLRYQLFLGYGVAFAAVWYAALQRKGEIASALGASASLTSIAVDMAPLWAILVLGVYAVLSVAFRVATMADYPDAADEIDMQVKEAKAALIKMGVKM